MSILPFRKSGGASKKRAELGAIMDGVSIEVMPRTAARIDSFKAILPQGTRIYIAHIEGTAIEDMLDTARRLRGEGFDVMPHVPARLIPDRATLEEWITRYRSEADVTEALVLAGGPKTPLGEFESAMDLLDTGLFEANGFTRLHVAGHPEGNPDIDPDGGTAEVDAALRWKQAYSKASSAEMAIVTQFAFDAESVVAWADRLKTMGIGMPIHLGIAGPAKLQTLIKFAIACGVGPSMSVLQKRAKDVTKLLLPYTPDDVLSGVSQARADGRGDLIERIHVFPLGGIAASAGYLADIRAQSAATTTAKA